MITLDTTLFNQVKTYVHLNSLYTYTDAEVHDALVHVLEHPPGVLPERYDLWTRAELTTRRARQARRRSEAEKDELIKKLLLKVRLP